MKIVNKLKKKLADIIIPNKKQNAFKIIDKIIDVYAGTGTRRDRREPDELIIIKNLKNTVEFIEKIIKKKLAEIKLSGN